MNPNCFKATYQGDEVWFILDDTYRTAVPPRHVTYTLEEAQLLANKPYWTRKMVHEAKKHGAKLALPPKQPNPKQQDPRNTITYNSRPLGRV